MFDLPHVASRVFGTPLMIARAKLEVILGMLAPRFAGGRWSPSLRRPIQHRWRRSPWSVLGVVLTAANTALCAASLTVFAVRSAVASMWLWCSTRRDQQQDSHLPLAG